MGTFIADLVLQILSFVAQSERENILIITRFFAVEPASGDILREYPAKW
jgi:hypothetical protein